MTYRTYPLSLLGALLWVGCSGDDTTVPCPQLEDTAIERDSSAPDTGVEDIVDEYDPAVLELVVETRTSTGDGVTSGLVSISAVLTGGPPDLEVIGVELQVDAVRVDTDLVPPYVFHLNSAAYGDGDHYIEAQCALRSGEVLTAFAEIAFNNTPPIVTSHGPMDGDVLFYEDGPLNLRIDLDDPEVVERATFRVNGLLVGELTAPPFTATVAYEEIPIREDSLPRNLLVQSEAVDLLGLTTEVRADILVMRRLDWIAPTLGEIWATAVMLPDGRVVVANKEENAMYAFNAEDGTQSWRLELNGPVDMALAIDPETGRVFAGEGHGGDVYGVSADGSLLWTRNIGSPVGGAIRFADGEVVAAGYSGTVYGIDPGSGSIRWSVDLGGSILANPLIAEDGTIYIGSQDHQLYAIRDGAIAWTADTSGEIWSGPATDTAGNVYFASNDGWVYSVTPSGELRWSDNVDAEVWSDLLVSSEGAVYVATTGRRLIRYTVSGDQVWSSRLESFARSGPVEGPDGRLYIGSTSGQVFAVEAETGNIAWLYDVGDHVQASPLVTDEHLYVGTQGRDFVSLRIAPPPEEGE